MAFSAHKTTDAMEELHDDPETFGRNVREVADLIRGSRRTVVYTGAGISTSAGIPDYRGPQGVWTLAAEGKPRTAPTTDMIKAMPTPTHMAIVQLLRNGLCHFVISSNVDGLHRKSGVRPSQIAELHGCSNIEVCSRCGRQYLRDYHITGMSARDHSTGQLCEMPGCGGVLKDNIIHFHENLEPDVLNRAFKESQDSTLHICLGSSLTVRPANELPKCTKECGGKVVIVNLQRTPLDALADVRVHSRVDDFLIAVMGALGIPIPRFELQRRIALWREGATVNVSGVEEDGMPSSIFSQITALHNKEVVKGPALPHVFASAGTEDVSCQCKFFGHYAEPDVTLKLPKGTAVASYTVTLDPLLDETWRVATSDFVPPDFTPVTAMNGSVAPAQQSRLPQVSDFQGWHAVQPLDDCPHTCECIGFRPNQVVDLAAPCSDCEHVGENMICLTCGHVACGRHVQSHMVAHREKTGHSMVCGFMDISFWCYACDAYISPSNPRIRQFYNAIHMGKFGCVPFA